MREMKQDKFFELRIAQFHWNPLPLLTSRHLNRQRNRILANSPDTGESHTHNGLQTNSGGRTTRHHYSSGFCGMPAKRTLSPSEMSSLSENCMLELETRDRS